METDKECRCHIVVRWQPVQGSDEDMPVYARCPIHPPQPDTDGYYDRPLSEAIKQDEKR